ncbi:hypothetical protein AAC387_Pa03g2111 [Persea americana]
MLQLPTARPKPLTQGQSKSYVVVTDCSHTGGGSSRKSSSNSSLDRSNKTYDRHPQIAGHEDSTSSNKPVWMSLSKLPPQKASVAVKLKVAYSCSKTDKMQRRKRTEPNEVCGRLSSQS